jgi:hypothetical protein
MLASPPSSSCLSQMRLTILLFTPLFAFLHHPTTITSFTLAPTTTYPIYSLTNRTLHLAPPASLFQYHTLHEFDAVYLMDKSTVTDSPIVRFERIPKQDEKIWTKITLWMTRWNDMKYQPAREQVIKWALQRVAMEHKWNETGLFQNNTNQNITICELLEIPLLQLRKLPTRQSDNYPLNTLDPWEELGKDIIAYQVLEDNMQQYINTQSKRRFYYYDELLEYVENAEWHEWTARLGNHSERTKPSLWTRIKSIFV